MPHIISPTVTQVWETGGQRYSPKLFNQTFTQGKQKTPKTSKKTKPELLNVNIH